MKFPILLFLLFQVQATGAQTKVRLGVLITEIMADPSPPVALPAAEYIELYNATTDTINLQQWSIQSGGNKTTINKPVAVAPDHYVVLCAPGAVPLFDSLVPVTGVTGFPSLDNDGALIQLSDQDGSIQHAVAYHKNWYQSAVKSSGGWSLEMMDVSKPCLFAANWRASNHASGGTPGQTNSVSAVIADHEPPRLLRAYCTDSISVMAIFDEALEGQTAARPSAYSINKGITVLSAEPVSPLFNTVLLQLQQPIQTGTEYILQCNAVNDCSGNPVGAFGKTKVGLPESPGSTGIVINEVLFNPASGGSDYVELYNASNKIFDLQEVFLAGRNATNGFRDVITCSDQPRLFFPGEYFVFSMDTLFVLLNYLVREPDHLVALPDFPSMPDHEGSLVIITKDNLVIDELRYSEKWHFPLLTNTESVALERINAVQPTNNPSNWTSAASTAGFGTPTYQNSQAASHHINTGKIQINPSVFSPDSDGYNDFAMIEYELDRSGYMGTLTVFDMRGRPVCILMSNGSLTQSGSIRWDGLDHRQRLVAPGMYIVMLDVFNLQGLRKKYKTVVIVAAAFK